MTNMADVPALKLIDKTAGEFRSDAVARIPKMTDRWTDFNEAELGMIYLTVASGIAETVLFELNMRASETTRTYVRQRPNAVRVFSLIGYRFKFKTPSRTSLRFYLTSPASVSIPIYDFSYSNCPEAFNNGTNSVSFVPELSGVIPVGATEITLPALQGIRASETFAATGLPDQIVSLSQTSIAEGTIRVKVDGIQWQLVDDWILSTATSKHVRLVADENNRAHLAFGDGISGLPPTGIIEVIYLITKGKQGDVVGFNRIVNLKNTILDSNSNSTAVRVTNTEDARGGDDEESLFAAKKNAPRVYAAQQRAVTGRDFVAWAESFPGIKQATKVTIQDVGPSSFLVDYYQIVIPIIPTQGNFPTAALKKALQDFLEQKKVVPDDVLVVDPEYVPVDVMVDITIRKIDIANANTIKSNVSIAIVKFFEIAESPAEALRLGQETEGQMFGTSVSFSQLIATIQAVPGVFSISAITPSEDIPIQPFEIPILAAGSPVVSITNQV